MPMAPPVIKTSMESVNVELRQRNGQGGTMDSNRSVNSEGSNDSRQRRGARRSFLGSVYHRLRLNAHGSRAKRAENVVEVDANAVVDEVATHELRNYMRQESRSVEKVMDDKANQANYDRQFSSQSGNRNHIPLQPTDSLIGAGVSTTSNRYILGKGSISFWKMTHAFEQETRPFVKVTHDIHVEDVASVMHRYWKMKSPRIVALIVSNVASLKEWASTRQRISFQKGLIKAANSTSMWIFTNGTNIGASKLIGDAVDQEKRQLQSYLYPGQSGNLPTSSLIPHNVVGIVREDLLRYGETLGSDGKEKVNLENQGNVPEEGKFELNPDHTHYIIVRDSTVNKTGINLFTLRLMQFLSSIGGADFGNNDFESDLLSKIRDTPDMCSLTNMEIPVVSIVIQGGYDCVRLVVDHLKRQFPVVVLRGSGGLADLLAYVYSELKARSRDAGPWGSWDPEFVETYLKPELANKIVHHFPKMRDNALARNMFRDRILECVRLAKQSNLTFMTILNMHNYSECKLENLSEYLLRALFKSKPGARPDRGLGGVVTESTVADDRLLKELYLTLDWNCVDVARSEVLIKDPGYVLRLQKDLFQAALLRPAREDFVDLFLTHGFRLHKFLTPTRLRKLFKFLYKEEFFRTVCWEGVLGHSLISRPSRHFIDTDLNWLIETTTGLEAFINSDHLYYNVISMYIRDAPSAERKTIAILTMWAVFGNRQKLARTFWKHSDQPIHMALIVSMMFERLSWYVGETNMKSELKQQSKEFAEMATGVLEACFKDATNRAFDVLSEQNPDWNHKTAVDIAATARVRSFLAHPCCQKWLTNTFLGEIRIRELSWGFFTLPAFVKILSSAILVFPMYLWVRFKPKIGTKADDKEDKEDDDERDGMGEGPVSDDVGLVDQRSGGDVIPMSMMGKRGSQAPNSPKQKDYDRYATLLREREVFIRSQPPLWEMVILMWTAPITKYYTFLTFYIAYLILFSLAVLWPSCGNVYLDMVVCGWTALIGMESIHRTWVLYRKYTSVPLFFKCVENFLIVTFIIVYATTSQFGFFSYPYPRKIILCFGLLYFFYRLIGVYLPISPTLGPMLYRLKLMVSVDFLNFMRMGLVVIVSGGIVIQAILFPDMEISVEMFRMAFHRAWFSLFLTPIDELKVNPACSSILAARNLTENEQQCHGGSSVDSSCPVTGFWPYLFMIYYLVFLKLILITLLYALFSATASKLEKETDAIWKYQRYILVVDFANRLPLPAPLSILCYAYYTGKMLLKCISCYYTVMWCKSVWKGKDVTDAGFDAAESKYNMRLSEEDYNFWRHLAREYSRQQTLLAEQNDINKKQWEAVQTIGEEIEYEKRILRQLKGRIGELERMTTLSHVYLENIKHIASIKFGSSDIDGPGGGFGALSKAPHILSRQSPYPGTRVQRMPVPDKYVPWEVMWIDYDPIAYTKPKADFPSDLRQFTDEDVLLLQELHLDELRSKLPVLKWNCVSTSPAGISIDRLSWCIVEDGTQLVYKLDNGIPRNPLGRTGLRGKGALPRWGPNHMVIFIITRWQSSKVPIAGGRVLEFVVMKSSNTWTRMSLPSRFIPGESMYLDMETLFKLPQDSPHWTSSDEVVAFFKNCSSPSSTSPPSSPLATRPDLEPDLGFKHEIIMRGYMDDPLNTDMSWKEVELWHFHYTKPNDTLSERMLPSQIGWRIITEDVFIKLPPGQAALLQDITNKLQPAIL